MSVCVCVCIYTVGSRDIEQLPNFLKSSERAARCCRSANVPAIVNRNSTVSKNQRPSSYIPLCLFVFSFFFLSTFGVAISSCTA